MGNTKIIKANKNYKAMNRKAAQDKSLSWKAKGIMFYFLSKPDGWKGQMYDLLQAAPGGKSSVQSAINELKAAGYVETVSERIDGIFKGKYYIIYDEKKKFS